MNGFGSLFILILLAALPIVLAYLWLVIRKYRFSLIWFLCALLAGIVSILIAFFIKGIIPAIIAETIAGLFLSIVVKTAIPEEASKFLLMFFFIAITKRWKRLNPIESKSDGAAAGLVIACGFAFIETIGYSMSDINLTFLRAVTASPIHAVCGIRIGMSAVAFNSRYTASGIGNIILAILIHTIYNFIILHPGTPIIFLVLVVVISIISSLMQIKGE
jgi:RsiW-degrading membrane proteinase PrsW (M82 family)